ncbi:MAG: GxGYxYP domain-containing protein, partial [Candidatus Dormibacteraceae bacterium]
TMSDGDNLQFDEDRIRQIWDEPDRGKVPINWSISPMLINVAPAMYTYYQRTQTANDLLIAGPSGAGYTYPGDWPTISMLESYAERTAELMKRGGLDIIYILNRIESTDIPLSDPVAETYLRYLPRLRGILYNGLLYSKVSVSAGELPVINQPWNITSVSTAQSAVKTATAGWDGRSPMFVAIQPIIAAMDTTDVVNFVESLGSEYAVVRGDVFFNLLRQHLRLPGIHPGQR